MSEICAVLAPLSPRTCAWWASRIAIAVCAVSVAAVLVAVWWQRR